KMLNASRKKRIAAGSGTDVQDVNKLIKMHRQMADMMKTLGKNKGMLSRLFVGGGPGAGLPGGMPDMAEIAKQMPGGMPELGPNGLPKGISPDMLSKLPGMAGGKGLPGLGKGLPGLGGGLPKFPGKK